MDSVLIIGGGGREHAILKALLRTERALCTYAYPGNPGMVDDGCQLVDKQIEGWADLADWSLANGIDLVVVGPEIPLVEGIVDVFTEKGIPIFGPNRAAARIEGSKEFSKNLMRKYGIPTADFGVFTDKSSALDYLSRKGAPIVVKASGLAAGKGAVVCDTMAEAQDTLRSMFDDRIFGDAAGSVVMEAKMIGEEASVFVLSDGVTHRILPVAQDHKRIGDGDTGPNTGGMGAYAPAPLIDRAMLDRIDREIIVPTLNAMRSDGTPYHGLLYVGVMLTPDGPKVVEFNCRFGDPETQAVLPLVKCDWFEVFKACATGRLSSVKWEILPRSCVAVVLASRGYPGTYEKGVPIAGIADAERGRSHTDVYHCGTARNADGALVTNGGRVLAVSSVGDSLQQAVDLAYAAADCIQFDGKTMRRDIAARGLARLAEQAEVQAWARTEAQANREASTASPIQNIQMSMVAAMPVTKPAARVRRATASSKKKTVSRTKKPGVPRKQAKASKARTSAKKPARAPRTTSGRSAAKRPASRPATRRAPIKKTPSRRPKARK
jgi:phosphoribosylamine--glycine ligase